MQNHTLNEFDIISRIKAISSQQHDVALGIGDDCALVTLPFANNKEQWQLAITCDTMNVNVHFFENISPVDLAYRAVAVNISDLAAMAATPR